MLGIIGLSCEGLPMHVARDGRRRGLAAVSPICLVREGSEVLVGQSWLSSTLLFVAEYDVVEKGLLVT